MAGINLISDTELAGNLKNVYTDYRKELFPIATAVFAQFKKAKKNSVKWGGNGVFFDVVVDGPLGANYSDLGYLPESSQQTEKQGSSGVRRLYATRKFDNLTMVGTASKEAAFVTMKSKIAKEIDGAMRLGLEETINGTGKGIKAIVSSTADTTHAVVTSPYGIVGAGQGGLWLHAGQYVRVVDATGVTDRGGSLLTSVTNTAGSDNAALVFATAITGLVATDLIVGGTTSDNAYGQSANGIANLLNLGGNFNSLHGIDAGTYVRANTLRLTAGTDTEEAADSPNEMDIWTLAQRLGALSGDRPIEQPDDFFMVTTLGLGKKFIKSYLSSRNITVSGDKKIDINGGYKATEMFGIPLIQGEYSSAGNLFMVNRDAIAWVDAADWQPVQYENSGAVRWISGRDAFETSFRMYFNTITTKRNAHALISGYTDTERYTPVV